MGGEPYVAFRPFSEVLCFFGGDVDMEEVQKTRATFFTSATYFGSMVAWLNA
jgi:hypothetical protein